MTAGEIKAQMTADFPGWEAYANGIESIVVKAQPVSNAVFNMAGQKVSENYKGLVIKNGKKLIVR